MDRDQTKQIIKIIQKAYPRFIIVDDSFGVDVWHKSLEDLDYRKAEEAAYNCLKGNEFPPSIAEIRKAYDVIMTAEKKRSAEINRYYEQARSYYPSCGEQGYGKEEFFARASNVGDAQRLYQAIVRYVNNCSDSTMDFKECIKRVKTSQMNP